MGDSWVGFQNRSHFEDPLVEPDTNYSVFLYLYGERILEIKEVKIDLATEKALVDHEYRLFIFVTHLVSKNDIIRQDDDRVTSGHPYSVHESV